MTEKPEPLGEEDAPLQQTELDEFRLICPGWGEISGWGTWMRRLLATIDAKNARIRELEEAVEEFVSARIDLGNSEDTVREWEAVLNLKRLRCPAHRSEEESDDRQA